MDEAILDSNIARHFSTPCLRTNSDVAKDVLGEYARALITLGLEACAADSPDSSDDLREALQRIAEKPLDWVAVWTPLLAQLERQLVRGADLAELRNTIVGQIMHLGAEGVLDHADVRLASPQRMQWGALKLPPARRIIFSRNGDEADIELFQGPGERSAFRLTRSRDGVWSAAGLTSLPSVAFGSYRLLTLAGEDAADYDPFRAAKPLARVPVETQSIFSDAAALIMNHDAPFLPWIGEAVKAVVLLDCSGGERLSATVQKYPGVVYLSFPAKPAEVAARLVHEASHQYFFALKRLDRLHDGSDHTEYFSPIKQRGRSLEMTLFAFHAFCNGALFHRNLFLRDPRFEVVAGQTLELMTQSLRTLDGHLSQSGALTPIGKMLWQPLAERMFAAA